MVKAGLLLPHEAVRLTAVDNRTPHETTWFAPLHTVYGNCAKKSRSFYKQ